MQICAKNSLENFYAKGLKYFYFVHSRKFELISYSRLWVLDLTEYFWIPILFEESFFLKKKENILIACLISY